MLNLSLGLSLGSLATLNKGGPVPPAGFAFLTDPEDGAYLTDEDGVFLVVPIDEEDA
tara:strand:- start:10445 stop:10615 length:171 start_codon:yes stop_codon:yes gene_type:complete